MLSDVVLYNVLNYPNSTVFREICCMLDELNLGFLEIGIPSKDPYLEGHTIKSKHKFAYESYDSNDVTKTLTWIKEHTNLRIVLMTYYDGFKDYKLNEISKDLYESILCVDDNIDSFKNIPQVKIFNSSMSATEIKENAKNSSSFCYVNSGIKKTGGDFKITQELNDLLFLIKNFTNLPVYVGFGVKNRQHKLQAKQLGADGIIIGSEFIRQIEENPNDLSKIKKYLLSLV